MFSRLLEPHSGILFRAHGGVTEQPVTLAKLHESDIDEHNSPVYQHKEELYRARLRSGHMHMGVKDCGRVVHYFWASPPGSKVRLLWGLDYTVPKGEWYSWDGFTDPAFRNRGLMQKAKMSFRSQLSADESIVSAVQASNAPSIAALKRAGFKIVKTYSGVLLLRRLYIIRYGRRLRVGLGAF